MDAQETRRLLELAGRAAGYDVMWNEHWQCFQHRSPRPNKFGNVRHAWVPYDDDGDALRLAVDLRLRLVITDHGCGASCGEIHRLVALDEVSTVHEATRLAIVRAAAAVGEQMENKQS